MAPKTAVKEETQYVTQEQFTKFGDGVMSAIENLGKKMATPAEVKQETNVAEASVDEQLPVPPAFERKAKEIIGEAVDHCELSMPAKGGTLFTVVIKSAFSNAPKDYLERYKADRRTREIGNEGVAGVEEWCKLIKSNLDRK